MTRNPVTRPIGIDLFAGCGGLSLGFEQAGFDIAAAVEIDPIHAAVHKFNFPRCATICRSVIGLSGDDIRTAANMKGRDIDVVFGGAPCQGFSMIGKRAFEDPRNRLVHEFVRIVVELNAKYFVFENVKGLTIGRHRQFLREVMDKFQEHGYQVVEEYRVLNAAAYGVPQDRKRLFLLGARKGLRIPSYPSGRPPVTVWDALSDLPDVDEIARLCEFDSAAAKFGEASPYAQLLRGIAQDDQDYGYLRKFDPSILTSSMLTSHTPLSKQRFADTEHGKTEPVSRFHKLDPHGVCNTLRAGTDSARGAFTSPRPIHPFKARVITVREAARLHSYPDWFRFHVTKWHGFREIGNSVPPLLGRAVGSSIIAALGSTPVKPDAKVSLGDPVLLRLSMVEASKHFNVSANVIAKRKRPSVDEGCIAQSTIA